MTTGQHPNDALFAGERPFPIIAACDHYAGSEKLITKALELQRQRPVFDVTMDCEDGAPSGQESVHIEMVVRLLRSPENAHHRAGVRIHSPSHPFWRREVDAVVAGAGDVVSHLTIPKPTSVVQVREVCDYVRAARVKHGVPRAIPIHVLIETHGALRDAFAIAALPTVRVLEFGLMDFVSGHHGAIPAACMKSPGQFEHSLLRRAKAEVVAAALASGCVAAHNVTLDLKNESRVYEDAKRAREEFGFLRMWSIHPAQIEPIVRAMAPSHGEIEKAASVLLAAQASSWGPMQHDGELHDRGTYRYFWEVMRRAKLAGEALPEAAEAAFFSSQSLAP